MADDNKKWSHPGPPPPLFAGKREKDFVKQVNDEVIERVIGQTIVYYPISIKHTNYHNLYGEAIDKTFMDPLKVHALVEYKSEQTSATPLGVDRVERISVSFHKRRLSEDQDLFVKEGDFILYGEQYYEILTLTEPKWLFGQVDSKFEIIADCLQARGGLFDGR
jgi:hypothetical protein